MNASTPPTFTDPQRRAIEHVGRPLMLIGGPGTGKTQVLTERVRWLIPNGHAGAFGTLVVTFGQRAARELSSRLRELLPADVAAKLHVKTISSLCLELLSTFGDLLGYRLGPKRLRVLAADDARDELGRVLRDVAARAAASTTSRPLADGLARLSVETVAPAVSRAKHAGIPPERFGGPCAEPVERVIAEAYVAYQARLLALNALDYGDLILRALELLDGHADARAFAQEVFTTVLIDEFQDVSLAEWRILQGVFGAGAGVTAAGDPDQTIHSWRGAMGAQCFDRFAERFPDAERIALTENHRSSPHIVAVSRCLVDADRRQTARHADGAPVVLLRAGSEFDEVDAVASAIDLLARSGFAAYAECAVMCRTNAQVAHLEKALLRAGIPYRVAGRGAFLQQPDVRHALAYLALALDPCDDFALRQVARRHLAKAEVERLRGDDPELRVEHLTSVNAGDDRALAAKVGALNALLAQLAELGDAVPAAAEALERVIALARLADAPPDADTQRSERLALLTSLARPHARIADFLAEVEAWNGEDPISPTGRDQVTVMTLHAAKGLEFRACFVLGANEGTLPHFNVATPAEVADERRLMYVGLTRGIDLSVVSYARERQGRPATPSRFLQGWPSASVVRADRNSVLGVLEGLAMARRAGASPNMPAREEARWAAPLHPAPRE